MNRFLVLILHVGYWFLYTLLIVLLMISLTLNGSKTGFTEFMGRIFLSHFTVLFFLPSVCAFYLSNLFLFPRFFAKRRWRALTGFGALSILGASFITAFLLTLLFGNGFMFQDGYASFFAELILLSVLAAVHGVTGLVLAGFVRGYSDIRHKEELNRKNYEMELDLIHARLNPHFLFNTLNNIDVLISQDPEKASASLNKLSGILRFMLYETKSGLVDISKELHHIETYLEIQKLRSANPDFVQYKFEWQTDTFLLEPMLFLPFIENAFKHGESMKKENAISIHFMIRKDYVEFNCRNLFSESREPVLATGGLGNSLIRKRLELLYPNRFDLKQWIKNGEYCVTLRLRAA